MIRCIVELQDGGDIYGVPWTLPDSLQAFLTKSNSTSMNADKELIFDKKSEVTDFILTLLRNITAETVRFLWKEQYTLREIVPFLHGNEDVLNTLLGDFEILKKQVRNGSKDAFITAKLFTKVSKRDLLRVFHSDKFSQKDQVIAEKLHQICSCINNIREMINTRHSVMDDIF